MSEPGPPPEHNPDESKKPPPRRMPFSTPPPAPTSWWKTIPGQLALVAFLFGAIVILCGLMGIIGPRSLK